MNQNNSPVIQNPIIFDGLTDKDNPNTHFGHRFTAESLAINVTDRFELCHFDQKIELRYSDPIKFSKCLFKEGFELTVNSNSDIQFDQCQFLKFSNIVKKGDTSNTHQITFDNCDFPVGSRIESDSFGVSIINSSVDFVHLTQNASALTVQGKKSRINNIVVESYASIELANCQINMDLKVFDNCNYVTINECTISRQLHITNLINYVSISLSKIAILTAKSTGAITIGLGCQIRKCTISKMNNSHNVRVNSCYIERLTLDFIPKSSEISIHSVRSIKELSFNKVHGKVNLDDFSIESLSIVNVNLEVWHFGYIHWAKNFKLFHPSEILSDQDRFLQLMGTSRELKEHFLKRQNNIYANVFRLNELTCYYYYQKANLAHRNLTSSQFIDWLILATNKWFSSFGTSVVKPLAFLLSIHTLLFIWLMQSNNFGYELCFGFGNDCTLGLWLNMISPVHKLPTLGNSTIYSSIDFFMRISSGYFIYYFLLATRKFGECNRGYELR